MKVAIRYWTMDSFLSRDNRKTYISQRNIIWKFNTYFKLFLGLPFFLFLLFLSLTLSLLLFLGPLCGHPASSYRSCLIIFLISPIFSHILFAPLFLWEITFLPHVIRVFWGVAIYSYLYLFSLWFLHPYIYRRFHLPQWVDNMIRIL